MAADAADAADDADVADEKSPAKTTLTKQEREGSPSGQKGANPDSGTKQLSGGPNNSPCTPLDVKAATWNCLTLRRPLRMVDPAVKPSGPVGSAPNGLHV